MMAISGPIDEFAAKPASTDDDRPAFFHHIYSNQMVPV